jgi:hypothetical protein
MKYESIFNNNVNNKTMKTKHLLALSLVLATVISALQAQVRIGDLSAPRSGVSLDLNRNDNTATTGLGLPVVKLVNSGSALPLAESFATLKGVMVYNETVDASAGLPEAGIYLAGTNNWVRVQMGGETTEYADIVLLSPLPATVWLGTDGSASRSLTITTSIDNTATLYYQWYYLDTDETVPQVIEGQTSKTFEISKGNENYNLQSEGKVKKYFCVVRNGTKSTLTARVRAVYGSGVFLNDDKWLNVLGYNLGVSEEGKSLTPAEQFEISSSEGSGDLRIAGYLYQWGRAADGHQLRDTTQKSVAQFLYRDVLSATNGVAVNSGTGQIDNGSAGYGQFILRNDVTAGSVFDWRSDYSVFEWADAYDPCRSLSLNDGKNWRLPTSGEWGLIYTNNYSQNTGVGLRFRPDGSNTSVFLPAAGYRNRSAGALVNVGTYGRYWSRSTSGGNTPILHFDSSVTTPATSTNRSYGFSVRCVSE